MPYFYYSSPIFQSLLTKGHEEFHIKLNSSSQYSRAYKDNTQKRLWTTIEDHIIDKWGKTMITHGTDYSGSNIPYMWIHILKPSKPNEDINHIIDELNMWFEKELRPYMIPKLVSIITKQIENDNKFFAKAIIEYQSKYGKDMTSQTVNTYFQDIRTRHMIRVDDSDDDIFSD